MDSVVKAYHEGTINGWGGEDLAREAWQMFSGEPTFSALPPKVVSGTRKMQLWRVNRKVLGKDTINYGQQVGDCVSFAAKNANEYLQCAEILLNGDAEEFKSIFPPYFYGVSRIFIGKNRLGRRDGSVGSWAALGATLFGSLASESPNVPKYSGDVANRWGNNPGPEQQFVDMGKQHLIKSAALVRNWDELVSAVVNGYPTTICSNQGFEMKARSDGFHRPSGVWGHAMCIISVCDEGDDPYAEILNSWDDVHGRLKDFDDGEELPVGVLRVRRKTIENMLSSGEGHAYSQFNGFPEKKDVIERNLFKFS